MNNEFYGDRMLPFHTPDTGEVDTENDFVNLQVKINNKNFAKYKIKRWRLSLKRAL